MRSVSPFPTLGAASLLLLVSLSAPAEDRAPVPPPDCSRPLAVESAYLEEARLHLLLRSPDGLRHAVAEIGSEDDRRWLFDIRAAATPDVPDGARVLVQETPRWQEIQRRIFRGAVEPASHEGIAVSVPREDYLLYFDDAGNARIDPLREVADHYRIHAVMTSEELRVRILDAVSETRTPPPAAAAGPASARQLFAVGQAGAGSLQFVYADPGRRTLALLRCPPRMTDRGTGNLFRQGAQTLGHLMRSHLLDVLPRPVSSLYRGLFLLSDTAVDTMRPDWPVLLSGRPIPPLNEGATMDLDAFEAELDRITDRESTTGTIDYLIDGEAYFGRLMESILDATESIKLRTYIFDDDDYAKEIADLLKQRSREGIDVQVLLDGLGTLTAAMEAPDALPVAHQPPPSVQRYLEQDSEVEVRVIPNIFLTGDHIKTVLVDGRHGFTGGMNIGREYRYEWHDMMAELHGPVIDELRWDFDLAWVHAGWSGDLGYAMQRARPRRTLADAGGYPLRVLYTRASRSEILSAQLEAIRRAERYIYIQNAYFSNDTLLFELLQARLRGVDVRVIIPLETDRGLITRDNALAANVMLEHGIRVYIYPGMSHVKAAVYDGWACFGSANFDRLSLRVNKEMNIATSHPDAVERLLAELFEPDFARSREVTEPFPERLLDHLVELFGDYVF